MINERIKYLKEITTGIRNGQIIPRELKIECVLREEELQWLEQLKAKMQDGQKFEAYRPQTKFINELLGDEE